MAAMMNTQALREAHVRTLPRTGRACPCCATLRPRSGDAKQLRRAQRRRENNALRAGREDV